MPTDNSAAIFINRSGINYRSRDHLSLVSANARQHRKDLGRIKAKKQAEKAVPSNDSSESILTADLSNHGNTEDLDERQATIDTNLVLRAIHPKLVDQLSSKRALHTSLSKRTATLKDREHDDPSAEGGSGEEGNHDPSNLPERQELSLAPTTPSSAYLVGILDPFMSLAGNNDAEERNYVQHYLTTTSPRIYYGHSRSETFVKAILWGTSTNLLFLQWILVVSKASELLFKGQDFGNAIAFRQGYGYSLIRQALTDKKLRYDTGTYIGLASASLVDSRVSGFPVGRKHITALRNLFYESPEGWHTIDNQPYLAKMIINMACVTLPQGSYAFPNQLTLDKVLSTFTRLVNELLQWSTQLRLTCNNENNIFSSQKSNMAFEMYRMKRRELLVDTKAPLSSLNISCYHTSRHAERSRTATVISMLLILWHLRTDYEAATRFMDTLHSKLIDREMTDPYNLDQILLAGILEDCLYPYRKKAKSRSTTMENLSLEDDLTEACLRLSFLLDAIELLEMIPVALKEYFLRVFSNWLVRDVDEPALIEEADLALNLSLLHARVRQEYVRHTTLDAG